MELKLSELIAEAQSPDCMVADAEARYGAELDRLAEMYAHDETRILLLAGPSSSGKTTTANLLADRLTALGRPTRVVSLDDFYRNPDENYPQNADGSPDYESADALNLPKLTSCMGKIAARQDCALPHYDFKTSLRTDNAVPLPATENGLVILEGLHALNPRIADTVDANVRSRLFVSVSTNINAGGKRILSGRKIRFMRRAVRDALYRGTSVSETLGLWPNVLAGEDRYLYPYKMTADFFLDTFHRYEVGLMYGFLMQHADEACGRDPFYALVARAAAQFPGISPDAVPQTSLLREFIPGGVYEHLYV